MTNKRNGEISIRNPSTLLVASHAGIHMLLTVAAAENANIEGGEVDNAYVYGDIDISFLME